MTRKSASPATAILLRRNRRTASVPGLPPTISPAEAPATSAVVTSGSWAMVTLSVSLHRRLVEQEVPLRVELVALDALGEEVDPLRVEHRHPRRLVRDLAVDLRPELVRRRRILDAELERLLDLRLDPLVAELGQVRARRRVRDEPGAAQEHVDEVRG